MNIDSHQHYWQPLRGDYDWMPRDNDVLNRQYTPADIKPAISAKNIDGTVLVQAAATVYETEYMLGLADATPFIKGVVGWIDFEDKTHLSHLKRFAEHPKFLGIRPMIQDIPDVNWMLKPEIQWAFEAVIDLDLTFDALGFPQHIDNFYTLIKRYPEMRVVFDHCMKPQIRDISAGKDPYAEWADKMALLAEETSGYCKLSGLITEADTSATLEDLKPFTDHVLQVFGSRRVMWGSDWPVCRLVMEYEDWFEAAVQLTAHLTKEARDDIFGLNAARFYRL